MKKEEVSIQKILRELTDDHILQSSSCLQYIWWRGRGQKNQRRSLNTPCVSYFLQKWNHGQVPIVLVHNIFSEIAFFTWGVLQQGKLPIAFISHTSPPVCQIVVFRELFKLPNWVFPSHYTRFPCVMPFDPGSALTWGQENQVNPPNLFHQHLIWPWISSQMLFTSHVLYSCWISNRANNASC